MIRIAEQIWDKKYRLKQLDGTPIDDTVERTWMRVAVALSAPEAPEKRKFWMDAFYRLMSDGLFLPAGRIIAGAGSDRNVTLSNCFTMGTIPDSMDGIFTHLKEAALTMQAGGGIGYDFSTLRPKGSPVVGVGSDASGPLSFMDVWDAMCRTVMSAGSRRGAMMATMRCDHPDIEDFITAKQDPARLRNFNLSVLISDDFMAAVKADADWKLWFDNRHGETISQRIVKARDLWDKIMRSTYAFAEPGVIFIDRVNADHNLGYLETIATTNPCGEKPMGPYASCLLGSINLVKFVKYPFQKKVSGISLPALEAAVHTAIRMMDNVIEAGRFPLPAQAEKARSDRQLGLGVTGLADALAMMGITYGSDEAVKRTEAIMEAICLAAYRASVELAKEKGPFPSFEKREFLHLGKMPSRRPFAGRVLPPELHADIQNYGIRNSLLVSIAPTGTISLFAGNVSSGIEPIFAASYTRKVLQDDGSKTEELVEDYAVAAYWKHVAEMHELEGEGSAELLLPIVRRTLKLPHYFVTAQTLTPEAHVRMQAAAQKWVDSSISKTINLPEDISFDDFKAVYQLAYDSGCKGCTTYRPNDVTGSILSVEPVKAEPVELVGPWNDQPAEVDDPRPGSTSWADAQALMDAEKIIQAGITTREQVLASLKGQNPMLHLGPPPERPESLSGETYKVKWPNDPHALFITINDTVDEDGNRRPFEVFWNSKNMEHFAWTVGLTRMISAVYRRGGDIDFVAEELKAVFDPRGGAWIKGTYHPSILALIGDTIQKHVKGTKVKAAVAPLAEPSIDERQTALRLALTTCSSCGSFHVTSLGGCLTCSNCGQSKCD